MDERAVVYINYYWAVQHGSLNSMQLTLKEMPDGTFVNHGQSLPPSVGQKLVLALQNTTGAERLADAQTKWPSDRALTEEEKAVEGYSLYLRRRKECDGYDSSIESVNVDIQILFARGDEHVLAFSRSSCRHYAPWNVVRRDGMYVDSDGDIGAALIDVLQSVDVETLHNADGLAPPSR